MGLTAVAAGMLSLGLLIPAHMPVSRATSLTMTATVSGKEKAFADPVGDDVPLLLRAARGEKVERPPVWMMRQAGRHMQVYRDLVKEYPTFRQRSEIADVATEIIKRNGYEGRIHIINRMSTDVTREEVLEYRVGVRVWVRVRVKVRPRRCSSTATLTCCHAALLPSYPPPGARVRRP